MKAINNYIQEKLHISKGYESKMTWDDFIDYLDKNGIRHQVFNEDYFCISKKEHEVPSTLIKKNDDKTFVIGGLDFSRKKILPLYTDDLQYISIETDEYDMDYVEIDELYLYKINVINADALIKIINEYTDD